MAFLPGIFGRQPAPAPAPAAAAPAVPANPAAAAGGGAGPATKQQTPANPGAFPAAMTGQPGAPAPAPAGGPEDPLAGFVDIFKPRAVDPNAAKQPTLADPLLGTFDPAAMQAQISKTNFAAAIPQERIQAALNGDVQAFGDAINSAVQAAFLASTQLTHGLVETGARAAGERVSQSMDGRIRNFQIRSQNPTNEALAHPAVAPMLTALKTQIATSNPTLTPEQVQQQAESYFTQVADVLTAPKQQQAAAAAAGPKEADFSYLLS